MRTAVATDSPDEPPWKLTMRRLPFVCPKCHRRYPAEPRKGACQNHLPTVVKVLDQREVIAGWGASGSGCRNGAAS